MSEKQNNSDYSEMIRRELFSAVIGDVMDILGHTKQFLPPQVQPLRSDMILVGRAMPVLTGDDDGGEGPGRINPILINLSG